MPKHWTDIGFYLSESSLSLFLLSFKWAHKVIRLMVTFTCTSFLIFLVYAPLFPSALPYPLPQWSLTGEVWRQRSRARNLGFWPWIYHCVSSQPWGISLSVSQLPICVIKVLSRSSTIRVVSWLIIRPQGKATKDNFVLRKYHPGRTPLNACSV